MDIKKEFEKNRDNMISDLKGLLEIPSVVGEAEEDFPFGREVQRALEYMLDLGASMGFETKNVDNYGGHIDFPGSEEGIMAIVGHIDVVPEGEGWTYEPFAGTVSDGWIYGRGVQDDKGPTIIGLYAMKILKDLGFQPKKTIRLILGLDEETSWDGMRYYLEHEKVPDFGIVPDADFPLIQCEKGLLQFDLVRTSADAVSEEGSASSGGPGQCVLETLAGGTAPNVVAGRGSAVIAGTPEALAEAERRIGERAAAQKHMVKTAIENGKLSVTVAGKEAHAAYPERGINAISGLMDLLGTLSFANEEANRLAAFYNDRIGFALDGSRIGCCLEDDLSGKLTFNVGGLSFDGNTAKITVDIRYPVTKSKEAIYEGMEPFLAESGFRLEEQDHIRSIYQESDHPVVTTLVKVYREISGDSESQPTAIGGATFARAIPNCMAYGPLFPGDPELEHQKNEGALISQMLKAGHIYAEAIYRLTGETL